MRTRSLSVAFLALCLSVTAFAAPAAAQGPCASTITITGTPRIGTSVTMTITGNSRCHSCLWVSKNQGPVQIGPITIPIGLPILNAIDYGPLPPSGSVALPIAIPNDPNLIGLQLFFTNVAYPQGTPPSLTNIEFSPAGVITFVP